jgi:hypothetical protein
LNLSFASFRRKKIKTQVLKPNLVTDEVSMEGGDFSLQRGFVGPGEVPPPMVPESPKSAESTAQEKASTAPPESTAPPPYTHQSLTVISGKIGRFLKSFFSGKNRKSASTGKKHEFTSKSDTLTPSAGKTEGVFKAVSSGQEPPSTESLGTPVQPYSNKERKYNVHMWTEHMSRDTYAGNSPLDSIEKTISLCQRIPGFPGAVIQTLNQATVLGSAFRTFIFPKDVPGAVKNTREAAEKLQVGQSIAIPVMTSTHAMLMEIERTNDHKGKKQFKIVLHNTGKGIEKFHHHRINDQGKIQFQTAHVIQGVSPESLFGEKSTFLTDLFSLSIEDRRIDDLYTTVLPKLDGHVADPSSDRRLWSHGQIGGSCSSSCVRSFLRSKLTPGQYKAFMEFGRTEVLLKTYTIIKAGKALSEDIDIGLEMLRKLESSLKAQGRTLSKELQETKKRLEALSSSEVRGDSRTETSSKCVTPSGRLFETAFVALKNGVSNPEDYKKAVSAFLELKKKLMSTPPDQLSAEEKREVSDVVLSMIAFLGSSPPITRDQIYLFTGMVSLVESNGKSFARSKMRPFMGVLQSMHRMYSQIDKKSLKTDPEIDACIAVKQKSFLEDRLSGHSD